MSVENGTICNSGSHLSAFGVLRAAQESESFAEAAARLQVSDLAAVLLDSEPLRRAWERGRFLRRLGELAAGPICPAVAAERLVFSDEAAFQARLESDPEAGDIWEQGRHAFFLRAKASITAAAGQGKPHALRIVERLLRAEAGGGPEDRGGFDHKAVPLTMLERITGIHRVQWGRWADAGLPRNPDGSFDLPAVFTWLRHNSQRTKTRGYRQKPAAIVQRLQRKIGEIISQELEGMRHEDSHEPKPETADDKKHVTEAAGMAQ